MTNVISSDIAVVGMACRFPGARTPEQYWENLAAGRISIEEAPPGRWRWQDYVSDSQESSSYCRWGGFIEEVDAFDASFFNISSREAESMDPQQRLGLEMAWSCFEDAGIRPSQLSGEKVGVFVGFMNLAYKEIVELSPIDTYYATGTFSSVIPNRISYHFNLRGPSVALDTACSSSLHAIHLACRALRDQECEMALTGGINLLLTPKIFIWCGKAGILSSTGMVRTFDEDADGTVRGEGAGFILLKPLVRAIADGNRILGIIKGSALNHGGKNATLTYPNAHAQAEVIRKAFEAAGVKPSEVSYVEAHGTGTAKGDPIEVQGLIQAFQADDAGVQSRNNERPWCGLGSVKPNIGHLEGAAGMAGVIKVLLALQHKALPPLGNLKKVNHRISLGSPFFFVDKLQAWESREPRIAGVSSFGFSGTNAHVVVAEAPETAQVFRGSSRGMSVVVLSARNAERLKEQASQLRQTIARQGLSDSDLEKVAFTLQVGREALQQRMAMTVRSMNELESKLEQLVEGKSWIEGVYLGEAKAHTGTPAYSDDELQQQAIGKPGEGDWSKLLERWVQGIEVDWERLYGEMKPTLLSLPTYPFARERYWISQQAETFPAAAGYAHLHPLIHQNTSDLAEQRFSSIFTGGEVFLTDHRIQGQRVLPAVAYLEMVREAVTRSVVNSGDDREPPSMTIIVKSLVWLRPMVVGAEPVQVHTCVFPNDRGEIAFEVYSDSVAREKIVYAQGIAVTTTTIEAPRVKVEALSRRYDRGSYSPKTCYTAFAESGIEYGERHQGLVGLHVEGNEVVARVSLPPWRSDENFVLHPGLMDSGLQAIIGFRLVSGTANEGQRPFVPFELHQAEIYSPCTPRMWVVVARHDGGTGGKSAEYYDIDLSDESGKVCVRLKGLSMRLIESNKGESSRNLAETQNRSIAGHFKHSFESNGNVIEKRAHQNGGRHARFSSKTLDLAPQTESSDSLVIHRESDTWARVRRNQEKYDIDLCDEYGRVIAQYHGWEAHPLEPGPQNALLIEAPTDGEVILTAAWEPCVISDIRPQARITARMIVIGGSKSQRSVIHRLYPEATYVELNPEETIEAICKKIVDSGEISHILWIVPEHFPSTLADDSIIAEQRGGVLLGFRLIKAMLATGYGSKALSWTVMTTGVEAVHANERANPTHASVHGLMGSLANEYANWTVRLIDLPKSHDWPGEDIFALPASPEKNAFAYREGRWYQRQLLPYRLINEPRIRDCSGEVYVIIGGHGGIGCAWSEMLLRRSAVQLVWIGRRPMDDVLQKQLERLAEVGPAPVYISADATDRQQLERARSTIFQRFGRIDGVVHAAMVLKDQSLANMTEDVFRAVLQPKIDACVRLAQVFGQDQLRFVLFFSSFNVFTRWANQSNYVAGSTFKDSFAHRMASEWRCRVHVINWGYWGTVGAVASERYHTLMAKKGLGSIEVPAATRILDELMSGRIVQMAYLRTNQHRVLQSFNLRSDEWMTSFPEILPSCLPAIADCSDVSIPGTAKVKSRGIEADFCNEAIARVVVRYIEERRKRAPHCELRVLDIGAETDNRTEEIVEAIQPHASCVKEYACTDNSVFLSLTARGVCSACARNQSFDIERAPDAQGIALDHYDLVIASNVLHPARNIRAALRNIKAVLRTNGLLILHELAANALLDSPKVGPLEEKRLFADTELRIPGGPAAMPEIWRAELRQEGFNSILLPAEGAHHDGHQVIVIESDGVIRQRLTRPLFFEKESKPDGETGSIAKTHVAEMDELATINQIIRRPREAAIEHLLFRIQILTAKALGADATTLDLQSRPFADMLLVELGVDSLSATDLRNTLRRELEVDLPVQRILGEKVGILADALYDELFIRRFTHAEAPDASEERETYIF